LSPKKIKVVQIAAEPKVTESENNAVINNVSSGEFSNDSPGKPVVAPEDTPISKETEILVAIRNLLDERDKAMPAIIRNEVSKMVQEERERQQPQAQIQPSNPNLANGTVQAPPFEAPAPGGLGGSIGQMLPAIMQMMGQNQSPQNAFMEQLQGSIIQNAISDMTFNRDFSRAFMQSVLKNVGGQMANQAVTAPIVTPTP
jgi:hypothetical protein